jgi:hypothetical protein
MTTLVSSFVLKDGGSTIVHIWTSDAGELVRLRQADVGAGEREVDRRSGPTAAAPSSFPYNPQ